jgi:hypothetical protein
MLFFHRRCFVAAIATTITSMVDQSGSLAPPTTTTKSDALILGGFLLAASAYDDYVTELSQVGVSGRVYAYSDPLLLASDSSLIHSTTGLLVGHSKGAKTVATWMGRLKRAIPCILIEPVDVDPPREDPFSVLELWESNLEQIALTPTLVISAPFTDTSKRYGKAKNLCAPQGKDANTFFHKASKARTLYPSRVAPAPLHMVVFPDLGHNDVTLSRLGGCSDGPARPLGSHAVASMIATWIRALEHGEDIAWSLQNVNASVAFHVITP